MVCPIERLVVEASSCLSLILFCHALSLHYTSCAHSDAQYCRRERTGIKGSRASQITFATSWKSKKKSRKKISSWMPHRITLVVSRYFHKQMRFGSTPMSTTKCPGRWFLPLQVRPLWCGWIFVSQRVTSFPEWLSQFSKKSILLMPENQENWTAASKTHLFKILK